MQVRIIRTSTLSKGSGLRESFWEVQKKKTFGWRTVAAFSSAAVAVVHAHKIINGI